MSLIADILLAAGALGAGFYCLVLGRRLNRFNDLEKGVGGAVAVLSAQVDDLNRTLAAAQATAGKSAKTLTELTARAEGCSRKLELQMASLHDLPGDTAPAPVAAPPAPAASAAEQTTHNVAPAAMASPSTVITTPQPETTAVAQTPRSADAPVASDEAQPALATEAPQQSPPTAETPVPDPGQSVPTQPVTPSPEPAAVTEKPAATAPLMFTRHRNKEHAA